MDSKLFLYNDYNLEPDNPDITVCEYVWISGNSEQHLRSKTMVVEKKICEIEEFPIWNYDGSSTQQAPCVASDILLKPVFKCADPFRKKSIPNSFLVLCETVEADNKTPAMSNFRFICAKIMDSIKGCNPWFGFEQEYILMKHEGTAKIWPLGFPYGGYPRPQGTYYCSTGPRNAIGRVVAESHLKACLAAGLKIYGINAEVFPGQWEYQTSPVEGITACDNLWMTRYILKRVAEDYDIEISFDPKPIEGDWNGTGCHINFSTSETRSDNGYEQIIKKMESLSVKHQDHLKVYGLGNRERLTGVHETSSMEKFSFGIANRGASVRIPALTVSKRSGYLEDRRPAGNCDPYLVAGILTDTFCNEGRFGDELLMAYDRLTKKNNNIRQPEPAPAV